MFKSLYSNESKKLRRWLRDQRKSQSLTMRELGEILDTPHSFIGKVENGERRLDIIEYLQYCDALKVNPCEGFIAINTKYDNP